MHARRRGWTPWHTARVAGPTARTPAIQRILSINELTLVTNDVVEAARTTLVIGDTGP
jgi:hypothetical protein